MLKHQHQLIKDRFRNVLEAGTGEERAHAFFELRRLLAIHEAAEEEIVHPVARRHLTDGKSIVEQRINEEFTAKKALADLEEMDVNTPEFISSLRLLQHNIIEHANHEEDEEFSRLRGELSEQQLARLGRAFEIAEAMAPTRPHPGVESAMANAIVGPFASMLDRARDAISAPPEPDGQKA